METVNVSIDGFVETLDALRNDHFSGSDAEWDLFLEMVRNETLVLASGPLNVLKQFDSSAEIIEKCSFESEYPKYASVMSWKEFVQNECLFGNDKIAVVSME